MDEREIQKVLEAQPDPLVKRIAENYLRVHSDRNNLVAQMEGIYKQYNEMYGLLIGVLRQLDGEFVLKKEFIPQFDFAQYKVRWEDAPEEDAFRLSVRHFSD